TTPEFTMPTSLSLSLGMFTSLLRLNPGFSPKGTENQANSRPDRYKLTNTINQLRGSLRL
ncbi:MAG: hypothetical protein K5905_28485, partial [Roseibium sp.]|uniref:hypothetical protein n=1 Tax=Roseibium sp. TaxID=1936156 RepID=UPI0026214FEB